VSRLYGKDGYGRELVDLAVDGRDVARQLVNAGKLKRWKLRRRSAQTGLVLKNIRLFPRSEDESRSTFVYARCQVARC
jgi:endonuclease YncB( thermonuclease family)